MKTELEKDGRWSAEIPGVAQSYGATRVEAIAGVTVLSLRVMADRIEHGEMPIAAEGNQEELERLEAVLEELLATLTGEIPNAETIAAIEAGRRGDVVSFNSVEEVMADLNAED